MISHFTKMTQMRIMSFLDQKINQIARANNQEMKPHKTRRELYQVRQISAKKGDEIPIIIAPGGGHCMWIRPTK